MSKIKNILIFTTITVIFILIYIFFIKPKPVTENLVSSQSSTVLPNMVDMGTNINQENNTSLVAKDFLTLLLNVKNIKLDDAIFSEIAFDSLRDSSIVLIPDGNEGRPNPFAPLGNDKIIPTSPVAPTSSASTIIPDVIETPNVIETTGQ